MFTGVDDTWKKSTCRANPGKFSKIAFHNTTFGAVGLLEGSLSDS